MPMKSSGGLKHHRKLESGQEGKQIKLWPRRKTKLSVSFSLMLAAQEIMNQERFRNSGKTYVPLEDQVLQQEMHYWLHFGFPIITVLTILL